MKFLIVNTDYMEFLRWLYAENPGLEARPYGEQMRVRTESLFGVADFYSSNLRKLGHEAWDVYANNRVMQEAWARQHGIGVQQPTPLREHVRTVLTRASRLARETPLRYLKRIVRPWLGVLDDPTAWMYDILSAQIKRYEPDILLNQDIAISSRFLRQHKPYIRLLIGQHASPLPQQDFRAYDLMISSLSNLVDYFTRNGLRSELHRFGFEPDVLHRLTGIDKSVPVTFVGSVSPSHASRRRWLDHVCQHVSVEIWGQGGNGGIGMSQAGSSYRGVAWGLNMYRILCSSRMTLNHHIDMAGSFANNMRLYEATGVGTCLVTDWKVNLHTLFEPGREVVAYRSPEECVERIQYYLAHRDEREAIAAAGQARTLRDHTYAQRMQELVDIVRKYL